MPDPTSCRVFYSKNRETADNKNTLSDRTSFRSSSAQSRPPFQATPAASPTNARSSKSLAPDYEFPSATPSEAAIFHARSRRTARFQKTWLLFPKLRKPAANENRDAARSHRSNRAEIPDENRSAPALFPKEDRDCNSSDHPLSDEPDRNRAPFERE